MRIAALVLLPLLALACERTGDAKSLASSRQANPQAGEASAKSGSTPTRSVKLVRVTRTRMERAVVVSGTLAADERVVVSAKVAGRLASIAVDMGSTVEQGDAVAQLETTDYQLRVEQAASAVGQARAVLGLSPLGEDEQLDVEQTSSVRQASATLEEARAHLQRARSLVEQKLIAPAEFDTNQATFVRAQSALDSARDEIRNRQATLRQRRFELRLAKQQLADTTLRAPIAGLVQERQATAGAYLAVGAPIATIVRVNPLRMRVEVPEREAQSVRVGQDVRVLVEGDDTPHLGRVARLAPALNEQSRTLMVEAELANPGGLRPGSFVRAEISVAADQPAIAVPTLSIVSFAGIEKVVTVKDGRAVEKEIKTGRHTQQWTEVLSGIDVGEAVVVEPGNLQQGQRVAIASTS